MYLNIFWGIVYPSYQSFKALKTDDLEAIKKIVIYWIIYGSLIAVEPITSNIIPAYNFLKLIFLISIQYPKTTDFIHENFVLPFLTKHENKIDEFVSKIPVYWDEEIFPRLKTLSVRLFTLGYIAASDIIKSKDSLNEPSSSNDKPKPKSKRKTRKPKTKKK